MWERIGSARPPSPRVGCVEGGGRSVRVSFIHGMGPLRWAEGWGGGDTRTPQQQLQCPRPEIFRKLSTPPLSPLTSKAISDQDYIYIEMAYIHYNICSFELHHVPFLVYLLLAYIMLTVFSYESS